MSAAPLAEGEVCRCPTVIEEQETGLMLCLRHGDVTGRRGPVFDAIECIVEAIKARYAGQDRVRIALALLLPDWDLPPRPELDLASWGLDRCTGCGGYGGPCRSAWAQQRKCCPDCSHRPGVPPDDIG